MMSDDAINWKTVKIPEAVRDDAQDDPRTYGEIMRAGLGEDPSVTHVDSDAIADAVAERLEGSKPIEDMAFEDWFEPDYATTIANQIQAELLAGELGEDLQERLDRIEAAAKEATQTAQETQTELEGLQ